MYKRLVVYHKNCLDGLCGMYHFKQAMEDAEYHAASYSDFVLPDFVGKDVYLVDFSYKREQLEVILKYAASVTILDHHKSALEDLWDLVSSHKNLNMDYCSLEKSGARIAYEYIKDNFLPALHMNHLTPYIEDRDLWRFKFPETKDITSALFSITDFTYESFDNLTHLPIHSLIEQGQIIRSYNTKVCNEIIQASLRWVAAGNFNPKLEGMVPIINAPHHFASEIGNIVCDNYKCDFAAVYYDSDRSRNFSLRSKEFDVSAIAFELGGGGHKNAAGFTAVRNSALGCL